MVMDDKNLPAEAPFLPLHGPHWKHSEPSPFVPLRLVLEPGGPSVELNRPEMLVGRHSVADLRLRLPDVSRRHCRFVFAEGRWQVFDLNSLNGVFVNGERVQQATLGNGDKVRIGSYTFMVEVRASLANIPVPGPGPRSADNILESIAGALPKTDADPGDQKKKAS
jgi:pSer/pThr/pTyr-binding forkhead associated (FHA) protein